jgi:hypothetical protein
MLTRRVIELSGIKQGFWKLKATADIGNKGMGLFGMLNKYHQPTHFGCLFHLNPPYQR